jgi:hypothetical protein
VPPQLDFAPSTRRRGLEKIQRRRIGGDVACLAESDHDSGVASAPA